MNSTQIDESSDGTTDDEHIHGEKKDDTPPLFDMKKQRTLWWTIVKLIAPTAERNRAWSSTDAVGA